MLTNFININDFKYYIEFDDSQKCCEEHRAKYVMLRNFTLMNDVVCDDDLYFIEKSLYDEQLKNQIRNKEQINCLCFPSNKHYSNHYTGFSDILIDDDFLYDLSAYNILEIITDEETHKQFIREKDIKQNLIKIYHPHIKTSNKYIVHVENVINNINVHYICNLYSNFQIKSETEIRLQNNIYSEYIEVLIPDIRDLFGLNIHDIDNLTYSTYYKEDLNTVGFDERFSNQTFLKDIIKFGVEDGNKTFILSTDEVDEQTSINHVEQYVPLALLTQPFLLQKSGENYYKTYFKHNFAVSNNYLLAPITLILFPYDYIDEHNHMYILSETLNPGTCSLYYEYQFKLASVCDFDSDGNIALLTQFLYPDKERFDDVYGENNKNNLSRAYCYFNGITNTDIYNSKYNELYQLYQEELDEINCLTSVPDYDKPIMIAQNTKCLTMNDTELLAEYKRMKMASFLEEYIDIYKTDIDFFGFRVEIATDIHFKNIIFTQNQSLSVNFLLSQELENTNTVHKMSWDDCLNINVFSFNINNLFDSWTQSTDTLIAKVYFIDRFVGFVIESNPIIITKEKFKYIVNSTLHNQLTDLTNKNELMKEYVLNNELTSESFNFINNLHCIVHNDTEHNEIVIANIKQILNNTELSTPIDKLNAIQSIIESKEQSTIKLLGNNQINKIIYQPIFFSTHNADNVQITANVIQNIGIDLHEYISTHYDNKFVLFIDNQKIIEDGRNVNYVIFNINANQLQNIAGTYYIYDDNNTYITKGTWEMVN